MHAVVKFLTNTYRISVMAEIARYLSSITSEDRFFLRIRRTEVLLDTLVGVNRSAFSPYKSLVVSTVVMCNNFTSQYTSQVQ